MQIYKNEFMADFIKKGIEPWVLELFKEESVFLAGGAVTSAATNKEINDFDIYFRNKESMWNVVEQFLIDDVYCIFCSDKSLTFAFSGGPSIQLIYYEYYNSPQDIFDSFDFTCVMGAYQFSSDQFYFHENFWMHNSQKHLEFNRKTRFPLISCLRLKKYTDRGYRFTRKTFMQMLITVNNLNIDNWDDFKAQIGQLYGYDYIQYESIGKGIPYSFESAMEILEKNANQINDDKTKTGSGYHPEKEAVAEKLLVSTKIPIKYFIYNGEYYPLLGEHLPCDIKDLIENKDIITEEISVRDYLGPYLYKWVYRDDKGKLTSIAGHPRLEYKIGESLSGGEVGIYTCKREDVERHFFGGMPSRVIIKMEYDANDIAAINTSGTIRVSKVTPIEVIDPKEQEV